MRAWRMMIASIGTVPVSPCAAWRVRVHAGDAAHHRLGVMFGTSRRGRQARFRLTRRMLGFAVDGGPCAGQVRLVRLLVGARILVLDVEIQRPVVVEGKGVTVADGEPVDRVRDLEPVGVIHRHRPERVHGWELVLGEMHRPHTRSSQRPTGR